MGVPSIVADTSLPSATLEVRMLVKAPLPSVVPAIGVRVLPPPDAAMVTLAPLTEAPLPSFAVTVIVEEPLPAVNDAGAAWTVEVAADTPPPPPPPEKWQAVLPESVN